MNTNYTDLVRKFAQGMGIQQAPYRNYQLQKNFPKALIPSAKQQLLKTAGVMTSDSQPSQSIPSSRALMALANPRSQI